YSSVENMGIIFMVLGLSMIFLAKGHPNLAALGFVAALFHAFNHALFKNLLFLGAGIIQHQVHSLNIDDMGGLIKRMPQTSKLFLIACMSISSLPLFNGFVSEWLAFQTALQVGVLEDAILRSLIPVMAAALALTAALAAACFVKLFGMMFLGLPRSRHAEKAEETQDTGMLFSLSLLAGLCFLFGIFPGLMLDLLDNVALHIVGHGLPNATAAGWLWLTPVSAEKASYSAPIILFLAVIAGGISYRYLRRDPAMALRESDTWDCGFGGLTPRMQYTSSAFTMPFRRIFSKVWIINETTEKQAGAMPLQVTDIRYELHVDDHSWPKIYQPIEKSVNRVARLVSCMQTGNIRVYLSYSFFTLIFLLWVIS
ncbi:MAG: hydrogenase 4 subunit B, partial [Methyloprofundus sp.]|nr:hydrogenase 4 subunit B [Methyloprofundus sp.]